MTILAIIAKIKVIALSPLVKSVYFSLALFLNSDGFIALEFLQTPTRDRLTHLSDFWRNQKKAFNLD
jgi:hypothetical protein